MSRFYCQIKSAKLRDDYIPSILTATGGPFENLHLIHHGYERMDFENASPSTEGRRPKGKTCTTDQMSTLHTPDASLAYLVSLVLCFPISISDHRQVQVYQFLVYSTGMIESAVWGDDRDDNDRRLFGPLHFKPHRASPKIELLEDVSHWTICYLISMIELEMPNQSKRAVPMATHERGKGKRIEEQICVCKQS